MVGRSMALDDGGVDRVFQTSSRVSGESGTVSMMTRRHRKYEAVKQQFLEAWRHPEKPKPTIMRIYQVSFSILFLCIVFNHGFLGPKCSIGISGISRLS